MSGIRLVVASFLSFGDDPGPTDGYGAAGGAFSREASQMETMRLRSIQQPERVDRLLESFISGTDRVPNKAYRVRSPSGLSHDLRAVVQEAHRKHRAWSVWTDDRETWLFTAEMSLALSRERGTPVLQVFAYSEYGHLLETGFWAHNNHGSWQRCAD